MEGTGPMHFWLVFYRWSEGVLELHFEHEIPAGDALEATVCHRFREGWHGVVWDSAPLPPETRIRAVIADRGIGAVRHCGASVNPSTPPARLVATG